MTTTEALHAAGHRRAASDYLRQGERRMAAISLRAAATCERRAAEAATTAEDRLAAVERETIDLTRADGEDHRAAVPHFGCGCTDCADALSAIRQEQMLETPA